MGENYDLRVGPATYTGSVGASGIIEHEIPHDVSRGRLTVRDHRWDLEIAHLNPPEADAPDSGVSGVQGRLLNMGYDVRAADGDAGPLTRAALRQFQVDNGLDPTGDLDDATRAKVIELHGC
jgi:N-acetylmuramoyl-L-alanine amidase